MKRFFLTLGFFLSAVSLNAAPVPSVKYDPIPKETLDAWEKACRGIDWFTIADDGSLRWAESHESKDGFFPRFVFSEFNEEIRKLPKLGRPFGLCLSNHKSRKDLLEQIPEEKNVVYLQLFEDEGAIEQAVGNDPAKKPDRPATDNDVRKATRFSSLHTLILFRSAITDAGLAHLKGFPQLTNLAVDCTGIGDAGLTHLKGMKHLAYLRIAGTKCTEAGLEHLAGLQKLNHIEFDMPISAVGHKHLGAMRGLRKITCPVMENTEGLLAGAESLTQITDLELLACTVTANGMVHLERFQSLRKLNLMESKYPQAGLAHLTELKNFEQLNGNLTDAGVKHLASISSLKVLIGANLTDRGVAHLKDLKNLETLHISGDRIGDQSAELIAGLPKLQSLKLQSGRITDKGVGHLTKLKSLVLLNLDGTKITDRAIADLRTLPSLKNLDIRNTKITGQSFAPLMEFTALTDLGINVEADSDEYKKLYEALPRCTLRR
jgi:internalin A